MGTDAVNADTIQDPALLKSYRNSIRAIAVVTGLISAAGLTYAFNQYSTYADRSADKTSIYQNNENACSRLTGNDTAVKVELCAEIATYFEVDEYRHNALLFGAAGLGLLGLAGMTGREAHKASKKLASLNSQQPPQPTPGN